jgi:hypothetical protein
MQSHRFCAYPETYEGPNALIANKLSELGGSLGTLMRESC